MPKLKPVIDEIDRLTYLAKNGQEIPEEALDILEDISENLAKEKKTGKEKKAEEMASKLEDLLMAIKENSNSSREQSLKVIEAINAIKIETPVNVTVPDIKVDVPEIKLPTINVPKIEIPKIELPDIIVPPAQVIVPDKMDVSEPKWLNKYNKQITERLDKIEKKIKLSLPSNAKQALPVRLSDGEKFYRSGGGAGVYPNIQTFADSENEKKPALVDDDRHVQTDVLSSALPDGAATSANQTNGTQKTQIIDAITGKVANVIDVNGSDGLVTVSPGHISTKNSSSTPLLTDAVFTGESEDVTNFGVLVVTVKSDVASATDGLNIQQSTDGTNWDCSDVFTIAASTSKVFSFQTCAKYFRILYTNGGSDQTYFRLQTTLKPYYVKPSSHRIADNISSQDDAELNKSVLTGLAPDGTFKNVPTTNTGTLRTAIEDSETSKRAEVDALGQLKTVQSVTLVGTAFENGTKDTNFWTEAVTGSGSVVQAGEIYLYTGETADSTAKYTSVRKGRKVPGAVNQLRSVARLTTATQANNLRRLGAYTDNEGFFFQVNGTTFGVGSRKGGVDTIVNSGSFNGNWGASVTMDTLVKRLVIDMSEFSVRFFVNDILLHTLIGVEASLTTTLTLPVNMENINSGGNTTDNGFEVRFASIQRLGNIITAGTYKYLGTNATTVCKYGAGTLQRIINVDNAGTVTIYDNTAGSGTQIAVIDTAKALGTLDFNVPFSNGLTIVVALGAKVVVVYE